MRRILLALTLTALCAATGSAQKSATPDAQLGAIIHQAEVEFDFKGAIPRYQTFIAENRTNRQLVAKALYHLGLAYERVGNPEARTAFERVANEFSTQKEAAFARAKLESGVARETTVKIWSGDPLFIDGFWHPSPDGRYLVGQPRRDITTNPGLFLHDILSNTNRRLTRGAAFHAHFTPDSRRVVFQWSPPEASLRNEGVREIRIVNVDGTGERTIFRGSPYKELEVSAVSADGKTAAVGLHRTDDTWQVGLVSLATGKVTILKTNDWRDTYVGNFSPDGRWLIYWMQAVRDTPGGGVYAIATDGSVQHPLIPERASARTPLFTPDGSRVVFSSRTEKGQDLWSIRVADGKPVGAQEMLSGGRGYQGLMGFSRDGSLYFIETFVHPTLSVADVNPATGKAGSAGREVTGAYREGTVSAPAWSPDGRVLAYQWAASDVSDVKIVLHRFDGTPDRELSFPREVALRGWSPDGRLLIASGTEMKLRDVDTGREEPFADKKQATLADMQATAAETSARMRVAGMGGVNATGGDILGAALHPDGTSIAIARRVITRSVGVTRNLFSQRSSAP